MIRVDEITGQSLDDFEVKHGDLLISKKAFQGKLGHKNLSAGKMKA